MAKIPELPSKYIWIVVLIVYIIPVLQPIGAPFEMSDITVEIYDFINDLPEGSIVIIGGAYVFAFDLESSAALIACLKQMARNNLRIVNAPFAVEAVQFHKYCVDAARVDEQYGGPWKYGEDYVQLPYMPGGSAAYVAFLEDVHSAVATDVAGTPLSDIPLMNDLRNHEDIAAWICPHWAFSQVIRYAVAERDIPGIYFAQAAAYAGYVPYMMIYPGMVWMTNGFIGGAQYERLEGVPGLGHSVVDAYAIMSVVYVGFVILGNITMLTRMGEEEEEP
jgi:hypothetical protein